MVETDARQLRRRESLSALIVAARASFPTRTVRREAFALLGRMAHLLSPTGLARDRRPRACAPCRRRLRWRSTGASLWTNANSFGAASWCVGRPPKGCASAFVTIVDVGPTRWYDRRFPASYRLWYPSPDSPWRTGEAAGLAVAAVYGSHDLDPYGGRSERSDVSPATGSRPARGLVRTKGAVEQAGERRTDPAPGGRGRPAGGVPHPLAAGGPVPDPVLDVVTSGDARSAASRTTIPTWSSSTRCSRVGLGGARPPPCIRQADPHVGRRHAHRPPEPDQRGSRARYRHRPGDAAQRASTSWSPSARSWRSVRARAAAGGPWSSSLFSPKGGVGRTTLAFNLAVALAGDGPVCLVDGSLQFSDLRGLLRVPPSAPSIVDLPTDRIREATSPRWSGAIRRESTSCSPRHGSRWPRWSPPDLEKSWHSCAGCTHTW